MLRCLRQLESAPIVAHIIFMLVLSVQIVYEFLIANKIHLTLTDIAILRCFLLLRELICLICLTPPKTQTDLKYCVRLDLIQQLELLPSPLEATYHPYQLFILILPLFQYSRTHLLHKYIDFRQDYFIRCRQGSTD